MKGILSALLLVLPFFSFSNGAPLETDIDHALLAHERVVPILEAVKLASRFSRNGDPPKGENLAVYLKKLVAKHGEKKVASSIYELAQMSMYDLMWKLAGDLDAWLVYDLYNSYSHAQNDPEVLEIWEKFKSGKVDRTVVPDVFAVDKRYNEHSWYRRVRRRMMANVDKYIGGTLEETTGPPPDFESIAQGKFPTGVKMPSCEEALLNSSEENLDELLKRTDCDWSKEVEYVQ